MSLSESMVEVAALAMPEATITQAFSQGEREKCVAVRRLNLAIPQKVDRKGLVRSNSTEGILNP